jgi:oligopeptide transport system substrate-binding protein
MAADERRFPEAMMKAGKLAALFVFAAALLVALYSLHQIRGQRPDRATRAARDGVLLLGNGTDIETLDPHLATGQPEHHVISTLFEGLVAPAAHDPDADAPGMAESWSSPDDQTWTFQLRADARWSDGEPLTSADFLYAFERILSPELGSHYAEMLYLMRGAEAFHKGETTDFSTVGARAPDERTLVIELAGPAPYFPGMLKHYTWFPVPRHAIEEHGPTLRRDNPWARPGKLVCNGPFVLNTWRINHFIAVEKNPLYWDAGVVSLNGIHFFPIDNPETEERMFLDRQLHATNSVPLSKIAVYRQTRPPWFHQKPELSVEFYRFNTTRAPLDDPRVRRALSLAIDRASLVDQVIRSGHLPATGLTPPGTHRDYPVLDVVRHDPGEARRLLAEAGYEGGRGLRPLEILTNSSPTAKTIAEFLQESWSKLLGVKTSILQQDWQVYLDSQKSLKYDISRAGWIGDYLDPTTFLSMWRTGDGNNNTGWSDPGFDELVQSAARQTDAAARLGMLREAEERLLDAHPCAPIFWRMHSSLVHHGVTGWLDSVLSHRSYRTIGVGE